MTADTGSPKVTRFPSTSTVMVALKDATSTTFKRVPGTSPFF